MPLIKSGSRKAISENIRTEMATKSKRQAVAIALDVARRAKKARGGAAVSPSVPSGDNFSGYIHGNTGGRTDNKPMNVAAGAYVVPADVISGLGQGNSHAGADALHRMFKMGPYGTTLAHKADGGEVGGVPIVAASGEMVVPPNVVAEIGKGDMDSGHKILDGLVAHVRKKTIKTLRRLPKPKKG